MLVDLIFDRKAHRPINLQIADSIMYQIEKGILKEGTALPSINEFNKKFSVARDTVERSYKELKERGFIHAVKGKGYFIIGAKEKKIKVLLIFNKISSFKKIIYYSFINSLKGMATVDLEIHHYNPNLLNEIIEKNLGKYHYYVIIPHFEIDAKLNSYRKIIQKIPSNELVLLDKPLREITCNKIVFQDFKNDIYTTLFEARIALKKYSHLELLFQKCNHHPLEIIDGVNDFCVESNKTFNVSEDVATVRLKKGNLYIVISDDDLVSLIQQLRLSSLKIGKDVGVISFNETPLKSLLDVTVVSTDFDLMGKTAAELILKGKNASIKNPFYIIKRGSI